MAGILTVSWAPWLMSISLHSKAERVPAKTQKEDSTSHSKYIKNHFQLPKNGLTIKKFTTQDVTSGITRATWC
jgi:hypothetical protein